MSNVRKNAKRRIREIRAQRDAAYENAVPEHYRRVEADYRRKAYVYLIKRGWTVYEAVALVKPEFEPGMRT